MSMFEKPIPKKPVYWAQGSVARLRVISEHMTALVEELRSTSGICNHKVNEAVLGVPSEGYSLPEVFDEIGRRADEAAKLWSEEKDLGPLVSRIVGLVEAEKLTCVQMQKVQREVVERCG